MPPDLTRYYDVAAFIQLFLCTVTWIADILTMTQIERVDGCKREVQVRLRLFLRRCVDRGPLPARGTLLFSCGGCGRLFMRCATHWGGGEVIQNPLARLVPRSCQLSRICEHRRCSPPSRSAMETAVEVMVVGLLSTSPILLVADPGAHLFHRLPTRSPGRRGFSACAPLSTSLGSAACYASLYPDGATSQSYPFTGTSTRQSFRAVVAGPPSS